MTIEDLHGAAFLPTDGQANPADITQALAKGARMKGAIIKEDIDVLDLAFNQGKLSGIITTAGAIQCEKLVCCMGQWTREFAARVGVNVPLVSVQHQYLVTEAISGITNSLPTLRDPDRLTYFKEEVGGLVMGGYEPDPIAWAVDGIPENFNFSLLDENVQHFEPTAISFLERRRNLIIFSSARGSMRLVLQRVVERGWPWPNGYAMVSRLTIFGQWIYVASSPGLMKSSVVLARQDAHRFMNY